jgi:hypothetical protein
LVRFGFTPSAALPYASGLRRFFLGPCAAEAGQFAEGHMTELRQEPTVDDGPTTLQLAMRDVNLRIFELASRYDRDEGQFKFACECGNIFCQRSIALDLHRFDPSMPAGSLLAHAPVEQEPLT